MAKIILDGQAHEVPTGGNLLQACLSLGLDLPYFCWHPALGSVGACRQCAVRLYKDESDPKGRLGMACLTPVTEGLRADLQAPEAQDFRAGIIETLMTNHPHDCPVCEEGGECHLQDMTLMTGHTVRHYRGLKRTHRNQQLGPFINHEMNRCIACYRCVRYYNDYAGGGDLGVFSIRNNVYFGRAQDGVLESEFSGNLAEVCPTGVFTDKTFSAHYARKWDLRYAPSICPHCAVGCNISPGERLGTLRRVINRYHGAVNGYFLCDRGRFGYGFVNGGQRIMNAELQGEPVSPHATVAQWARRMNGHVIGIGSPRASLEANFALRERVGPANFYAGFSRIEAGLAAAIVDILHDWPVRVPAVREMERADAVLVLGEDVTNTAPRLALALRQAVRNRGLAIAAALKIPAWLDSAARHAAQAEKSPLFIASPAPTRLDDVASATHRATPEAIARLGFAIAHALDAEAPPVVGLSAMEAGLAETIAATLAAAERPLLVSGMGCASLAVVRAAGNIARALAVKRGVPTVDLCYAVPECNTLGLALMDGHSVEDAFAAARENDASSLIVLENDLYRRAPAALVDAALARFRQRIVIDHSRNATTARADLLLPSGSFAETEGTLVSLEGRAQRFFSVMPPLGAARDAWRWPFAAQRDTWQNLDAVTAACAAALPVFARIVEAAPAAGFRIEGDKIARAPARYSGRTAMHADQRLHEPKPPDDPDSALSYSMEGAESGIPPALRPVAWAPHWNSHQQATTQFQDEAGGTLRGGDPGVRLIEPADTPAPCWFEDIPPLLSPDEPDFRAVILHRIFGGEELSALAAPIIERAPAACALMHPDDIARLGLGDGVTVAWERCRLDLPLRPEPGLAQGVIGLPEGGVPGGLPERVEVWAPQEEQP
ncbi:NADH-quinone oxidoreductase subunit NuoG [Methylomagnum ishizawai]|uniref:NADH-quinone oxidoreductase subunit NuoG n=1 Tax=Methylomagnum ishizawai TaxID=1760988 RepID=UPI001C334D47|nr:NADH-quinone oxidoreductase subunit NuoG [Methylomagnum ishizawai]BBL74627.1 NADH-quinone oxidoreductase subunit G [Methylomagnum ishizawai]